ncbi:MAG: hypothetical protein IJ301_01355 [Clostridia bacterium]|nr:hypothetical protein [Clostridia bacterium]
MLCCLFVYPCCWLRSGNSNNNNNAMQVNSSGSANNNNVNNSNGVRPAASLPWVRGLVGVLAPHSRLEMVFRLGIHRK